MARLLVYYAHPGHRHSQVNRALAGTAAAVSGITFVDLYAEYPRFEIHADVEQQRLIEHDVIVFQFPLFWYSTPSILKEWEDLVLEYGFAYGQHGDRLAGKRMQLAITVAAPPEAFSADGYQNYSLRTFLRPLEQTATLCRMRFESPYVLFSGLRAPEFGFAEPHIAGYRRLLEAIRDDRYDFDTAGQHEYIGPNSLPIAGSNDKESR